MRSVGDEIEALYTGVTVGRPIRTRSEEKNSQNVVWAAKLVTFYTGDEGRGAQCIFGWVICIYVADDDWGILSNGDARNLRG